MNLPMDISSDICMLQLRRIVRSHQGKGNRMTTGVKEKTLAPSEPEFGQPLVIQDCFLGFWWQSIYIGMPSSLPPEIVSTENYSLSLLPTVLSPSVVFCCCRQFRFPGGRSALICFLLLRSGKPGHGPADSTCRKPEGGEAATDKKVVLLFFRCV